jgi:hypothetical protein
MRNFGTHFDPANKQLWAEMASSRGTGLILRSIRVEYKFVSHCNARLPREQARKKAFLMTDFCM